MYGGTSLENSSADMADLFFVVFVIIRKRFVWKIFLKNDYSGCSEIPTGFQN